MPGRPLVIRITHEFVEAPEAINRAYDTWARLLARSLDLSGPAEEEAQGVTKRVTKRKRGAV